MIYTLQINEKNSTGKTKVEKTHQQK